MFGEDVGVATCVIVSECVCAWGLLVAAASPRKDTYLLLRLSSVHTQMTIAVNELPYSIPSCLRFVWTETTGKQRSENPQFFGNWANPNWDDTCWGGKITASIRPWPDACCHPTEGIGGQQQASGLPGKTCPDRPTCYHPNKVEGCKNSKHQAMSWIGHGLMLAIIPPGEG